MATDIHRTGYTLASQSDIKDGLAYKDIINSAKCDKEDLNDVETLRAAFLEVKEELKRTQEELHRVRVEKEAEHVKRVDTEHKLKRHQDDKEKQSAALIEASRELQAALSERENLMEQEDRIRAMVEEAEKAFQLCKDADNMDESELEDENSILSDTAIIFKAKLKEMRNKLQESIKQQSFLEEENTFLRDELKTARDAANSLPLLRNELATAQSVSTEREEKCASLQAQLCRAEFTVQEVKSKILALQDKLIEEQETAAKHSEEAKQLRIICKTQAELIEELRRSEKEANKKLDDATEQIEN